MVIPKAHAITRGALAACTLAVLAALASLAGGACASRDGQAPGAADGPPPTLRQALTPAQLDTVALLDGQTPFPPTAGRAVLFVDGDFYAQAADAVRSYVADQLRQGIPVAFFGDQAGYDALRSSAGAAGDLPADPAAAHPAAARGLKVYPPRSADEPARSAAIEVSGPPGSPAPLVEPVIRWAEDCAGDAA